MLENLRCFCSTINFEICIMRVVDLQIQIENTLFLFHLHCLAESERQYGDVSMCTYIRVYVCMCVCGLAALLFVCVWKRAMISIWRTSCTVRYGT